MTRTKTTSKSNAPSPKTGQLSENFVLLDNSSGSDLPSLLFVEPTKVVEARRPDDVFAALAEIESLVRNGAHAAGFFSYELGYALEPRVSALMPQKQSVPLLWFGLYEKPIQMSGQDVEEWLANIALSESHEFSNVTLAWERAEYQKKFAQVLEMIRQGDIYQLNLTFKSRFRLTGSPLTFYRDLRAKQRVAYGGVVDTGEATVISASPELFIELSNRTITTRPMKGTAPREGSVEADRQQRDILATDIKQRAENLMIVDLMRNDLGRIAEMGSVKATDLFTVETFKTLHQMTSGVSARLRKDVSLEQLLRAIFPPGSVTGAPKIRAMELIRELETEPRGVYCGAIGRFSPDETALFNVAIRTPTILRDGSGEMGIGSGIVFDSQGGNEYDECLLKMKFLTDTPKSFDLIETMLRVPGEGIWLLDRHMSRLSSSASYFGFRFDERAARTELQTAIKERRSDDDRLRVRLVLSETGQMNVTTTKLEPPDKSNTGSVCGVPLGSNKIMRFAISQSRLDSRNPFLYHKTTRRELYDREWREFNDQLGVDEVVYLNENKNVAEGSRTTIFVDKGKPHLLTPPLTDGLLPGTLRAELINSGKAVEAHLTLADLASARAVFLGNSVRGLLRATLVKQS